MSLITARHRKSIGLMLLGLSLLIGLVTLYWGAFSDEADNLVVGNLIQQGYILYNDVFSHHFPFPYYWMAAVIAVFDKSILVSRLSVLIFQTITFAISMKLSGNYLLLGVAALIWSILRLFYRGHMVLYSSFAGVALLAVFVITIALIQQKVVPHIGHLLAISIFSTIAFLSDPLTSYALFCAIGFLCLRKPIWGIQTGGLIVVFLSLYVGVLLVTDSYQAFWQDAVLFNSQIYAKYNYADPIRFGDLFTIAAHALEVADEGWLKIDLFRPIVWGQYKQFDQWFFTGFLYRISVIICVIYLLLKKDYLAAAFFYLFVASTLVIHRWDFRSQPFVMVSLMAVSAIVVDEWKMSSPYFRVIQKWVRAILIVLILWLNVRLVDYIYVNRASLDHSSLFSGLKAGAAHIQELTCEQPNVLLAHYPEGNYWYWFTDLKPVSRYIFMWPWVAEIGLSEVIDELEKQDLVVVVLEDRVIWGTYHTKEYLLPLYRFLETSFHKAAENMYISPNLAARCQKEYAKEPGIP